MIDGLRTPVKVMSVDDMAARIEELEAKLAKATDTLARIVRGDDDAHNWAIWTLAKLKKETND